MSSHPLAPASHQTKISSSSKAAPGHTFSLPWCTDSWGWRLSLHQAVDLQAGETGVKQEDERLPILISAFVRVWQCITLLASERAESGHLAAVLVLSAFCSEMEARSSDAKVFFIFNNLRSLFKVTFGNVLVFLYTLLDQWLFVELLAR